MSTPITSKEECCCACKLKKGTHKQQCEASVFYAGPPAECWLHTSQDVTRGCVANSSATACLNQDPGWGPPPPGFQPGPPAPPCGPAPCNAQQNQTACAATHCVWAKGKCARPSLPPLPPPSPPGPSPPKPSPPPTSGWDDACTPGTKGAALKFCDAALPMDERLDDLVSRVSLNETAGQLTARESPLLDRLGLPAYYWGTNAIHGVQDAECLNLTGGCPTSFPAPCSMAASFNMSLVHDMGNVIGRELRAYYNARRHNSLDTWSPTININRDPRWGRNVESPGEDPLLNGLYGTAYTQGLQQYTGIEKVVQAVVTLKHWLAYSIEGSQLHRGCGRHNIDVSVSAYDLAHTYMPPFEHTVKHGKALGIMCSYNAVNGIPTCGNPALNQTLRHDWGFEGYVTSDTDACGDIQQGHNCGIDNFPARPTNGTDATRQCLMGGTDINSGGTYMANLAKAVRAGELDEKWAELALKNTYRMRMKAGLFDPSPTSPYKDIGQEIVGSAAHQELSLDAARKGMVLLKRGGLPFPKGKRLAVVGQAANDTMSMTGNYDGPLCPGPTSHIHKSNGAGCWPSIGQAFQAANTGGKTTVVGGVMTGRRTRSWAVNVSEAVAAVKVADFIVLVVDNFLDGGGEGHDRSSIGLSTAQMTLATAVLAAASPSSGVVLVTLSGGLISLDGLKDSAQAILSAGMPGVHGGVAIASTVFGENNPGGKLPATMYHSNYTSEVPMDNMSMVAGVGRSYKYYTGVPLFSFGFGLSYTEFDVKWASPPPILTTVRSKTDSSTTYKVAVTNIGKVEGDEVVLAYTKPKAHTLRPSLGLNVPIETKKLFGFQRVTIPAGGSAELSFDLTPTHLAMVDEDGHTGLHTGEFEVVFSRGHGEELVAQAAIRMDVVETGRLKTFRKWW